MGHLALPGHSLADDAAEAAEAVYSVGEQVWAAGAYGAC